MRFGSQSGGREPSGRKSPQLPDRDDIAVGLTLLRSSVPELEPGHRVVRAAQPKPSPKQEQELIMSGLDTRKRRGAHRKANVAPAPDLAPQDTLLPVPMSASSSATSQVIMGEMPADCGPSSALKRVR
jgi:hypothetical protein